LGDGWYACAPETVAIAHPFPNIEVRIGREFRGPGFVLTVVDLEQEQGESSSHATVDDAKEAAARLLKHSLHWK
jgi:hypothetical protein